MQEDNVAFRLKLFMKKIGVNSTLFAANCGISPATLSQLLTGRNKKISDVLVSQIHKAYPELSIMWLLFNEGEMMLNNGQDSFSNISSSLFVDDYNFEINNGSKTDIPSNTFLNQNNENPDFTGKMSATSSEGIVNGVNLAGKLSQSTDNKQNNREKLSSEFTNDSDKLATKQRRVIQVTIYYDDNTFESFFPH